MKKRTEDLRIAEIKEVLTPLQVHDEFPITDVAADTVAKTRQEIHEILHGNDDRVIDSPERLVIDVPGYGGAGCKIVKQDIGLSDQPVQDLLALGAFHI